MHDCIVSLFQSAWFGVFVCAAALERAKHGNLFAEQKQSVCYRCYRCWGAGEKDWDHCGDIRGILVSAAYFSRKKMWSAAFAPLVEQVEWELTVANVDLEDDSRQQFVPVLEHSRVFLNRKSLRT